MFVSIIDLITQLVKPGVATTLPTAIYQGGGGGSIPDLPQYGHWEQTPLMPVINPGISIPVDIIGLYDNNFGGGIISWMKDIDVPVDIEEYLNAAIKALAGAFHE